MEDDKLLKLMLTNDSVSNKWYFLSKQKKPKQKQNREKKKTERKGLFWRNSIKERAYEIKSAAIIQPLEHIQTRGKRFAR